MKHGATGLLIGLALTVSAPIAALANGSQANPGYTFTRSPSHGKPGTVIHIEGTGCAYEGKPYEYAKVYLFFREKDGTVTSEAEGTYDIADDGSFSGELVVPKHARPGLDLLPVRCYASDMVFPVAESDFTVDGPSPTPSGSPSKTGTPSPSPSPRLTASPTPSPRPSVTRSPSSRPTPLRSTSRALPSLSPPGAVPPSPSPSSVASSGPVDPPRGPSAALVMAAVTMIVANSLGVRTLARRPSRS